jgi:hypothetical protein
MKAIIYYIFFFCMSVSHPCQALSSEARQHLLFDDSVKKIQQQNLIASDNSQNTSLFFEDDCINDDDETTFIKKRISFVHTASFGSQYALNLTCKDLYKIDCYTRFSYLSLSNYLSLRILRL